jgi:hypothetical protein
LRTEPDNKNARPILRYAEIRRIQKLEAHLVTKAAKPVGYQITVWGKTLVKEGPDVLDHDSLGLHFLDNPESRREKIALVRFAELPACGCKWRARQARQRQDRCPGRAEGPDITLDDRPAGPVVLQCPACAATVRLI